MITLTFSIIASALIFAFVREECIRLDDEGRQVSAWRPVYTATLVVGGLWLAAWIVSLIASIV